MTRRYAAGTDVPPEKSRAEIARAYETGAMPPLLPFLGPEE